MIAIGSVQLWVHDQDAALEFWTKKVGFEVGSDVTMEGMGGFRWVTVRPPKGGGGTELVLMAIPGPPIMDEATAGQVADLMGKGFAGTIFLTTDDLRRDYEQMSARGVEFTEKPHEQPYGMDSSFRDPSGNNIRLAELGGDWA